ncbi:MAG: hypothetical protein AAF412_07330 [Pseudomonadota bacterium]
MAILGNIGNGFDKLIRVREKQAQLSVHAYLASLDDSTLNRAGIKRDALKKGGQINYFM